MDERRAERGGKLVSSFEPPKCTSLRSIDPCVAELVLDLLTQCSEAGLPLVIVEARRSSDRQAWLWASGRTRIGPILTHARPGTSRHESGRAVDLAFKTPAGPSWTGDWATVGAIAERLGATWGGRWKLADMGHVEWPQ